MSPLPRVTELTRERITREFDSRGPDACMAEIFRDLKWSNPEFLEMAHQCAADLGNASKIMVGFGMFYRLLLRQSPAPEAATAEPSVLSPLPRVTPETRDLIVQQIDELGGETFTMDTIEELEEDNPELLQLAHGFASRSDDYLGVMQGFALLYSSLIVQSIADRARLH